MDLQAKAAELVTRMTLEEKALLLVGKNFWHLNGVPRLGLPSIMVTDGPHGLRKQEGDADHLGLAKSVPATCFPTASAVACTFDEDLVTRMGEALGEECRQEDVAVLLGPAANEKRSPLCGRNFEYLSEDPLLTGKMAAALINGIQSKGVGTSLKHFAANNQEKRRMTSDSVVDPRALREIYLKGFEIAVREAQPWTVMSAYNQLNGVYCSENEELLTRILREEWGFQGATVTDWGAINNPVASYNAGLDIDMPGIKCGREKTIIDAVRQGQLPETRLDAAAARVTALILKYQQGREMPVDCDMKGHLELARQIAESAAVLLKNDGILPCSASSSIAVIGAFAKTPRYQGAGSSKINPVELDNAFDALSEAGCTLAYAPGYDAKSGAARQDLIDEATAAAAGKDIVLVFAGLPDAYESEGFDRRSMAMPASHNQLIEAVCTANPNTVVVLQGGSPMEMPWHNQPRAILLAYLGGCQGGHAVANLLLGSANPSGKLAETFPIHGEDNFSASICPARDGYALYLESIYVGYRYYDTAGKAVLYPFGHGLSYTSFTYSDMTLDGKTGEVSCKVTNTGAVFGAEAVQLYIAPINPIIFKARHELKAFKKVKLAAGESTRVSFTLSERDFAHYSIDKNSWAVEAGSYEIQLGASSRDIRLKAALQVNGVAGENLRDQVPAYYDLPAVAAEIPAGQFAAIFAGKLPEKQYEGKPYHINSTFSDIEDTWIGKLMLKFMNGQVKKMANNDESLLLMVKEMTGDIPLRQFSMANINTCITNGIIEMANGHFFRGLARMLKR